MKQKALLLTLIVPLLLTSCKKSEPNTEINGIVPSYIRGVDGHYKMTFEYNDSFFMSDAKEVNKDIALLSYGSSVNNVTEDLITNFYNQMQFDNIYTSEAYAHPTPTSINYLMGHRKISNHDLVAISIRGFDYTQEWVSNLTLGVSGDHQGFSNSADIVYNKLKSYISENNYSNLKLWITGYSRAGGVSNVLSHYILSRNEIEINNSNMYVYTFEAPRGLLQENAPSYENVHNFINDADPVPLLAPAKYDIYRCGNDISIYSEDVDNLIKKVDKKLKLPAFTPYISQVGKDDYEFETEFDDWLMNILLGERENMPLTNREQFVSTVQEPLGYLMAMFFSLTYEQQVAFQTFIGENLGIYQIVTLLFSESRLYEYLAPYLTEWGVEFDEEKMENSCTTAVQLVKTLLPSLLGTFVSRSDNFSRMIDMHMPEVNYALLLHHFEVI